MHSAGRVIPRRLEWTPFYSTENGCHSRCLSGFDRGFVLGEAVCDSVSYCERVWPFHNECPHLHSCCVLKSQIGMTALKHQPVVLPYWAKGPCFHTCTRWACHDGSLGRLQWHLIWWVPGQEQHRGVRQSPNPPCHGPCSDKRV
jgi:hypothetical protein